MFFREGEVEAGFEAAFGCGGLFLILESTVRHVRTRGEWGHFKKGGLENPHKESGPLRQGYGGHFCVRAKVVGDTELESVTSCMSSKRPISGNHIARIE